jgi:glutamate synthase (NADPH/NADH) small chain
MRLGQPDASGRRAPEPDSGQRFTLEADLVIKALGLTPKTCPSSSAREALSVTRWGTLKVDTRA